MNSFGARGRCLKIHNSDPLLNAKGVSKFFSGVQVLTSVDFDLHPGEIHGLIGENGAGKSTLLKIISGVHLPEEGSISIDNKPVNINSSQKAQELGIALIHQEPLIFPDLDVAENIAVGRYPTNSFLSSISWSSIYRNAKEVLDLLEMSVNVRARAGDLSTGQRRIIEIAEAISGKARILLMDEPTSALAPSEVDHLFKIMKQLTDRGTAIVFVSHRLEEVITITDRITVLRDGKAVGRCFTKETNIDNLISLMVGRELSMAPENIEPNIGKPVLEVKNVSCRGIFTNISFSIHAGEIVGLAGLVGAGRSEMAQALFGAIPIESGQVYLMGKPVQIKSPRIAINLGLAYVSEDRQNEGLLMSSSVSNNMIIAILRRISKGGWINTNFERKVALEYKDKLRIRLRNVNQPIRELSGGNQQKVVLARWLLAKSKVLILDEPTHGIDVGAKVEVHRLMRDLANQGVAILMISSEMPEILAMSDRVVVMMKGRVTAQFKRAEATAEKILAAAVGHIKVKEGAIT